jgi:hypothetical protein
MRRISDVSPALVADLRAKGADLERTLQVLALLDAECAGPGSAAHRIVNLPSGNDSRISERTGSREFRIKTREVNPRFAELSLPIPFADVARIDGEDALFSEAALYRIGVLLYPKVAYGVLNGGSATTYIDAKKNRELDPEAFEELCPQFERAAEASRDTPKGATSAYFEADGEPGPSFLLLKMRSLLLRALEYRTLTGDEKTPLLPFFQMTSLSTDEPLRDAYRAYRHDPLIAALIERTDTDPTAALGAVQPLLAALTHVSDGLPRRIFDKAFGQNDSGLALPGGHGENFRVLAATYRTLRARGIRWAYLGNVDNSGYTVDPVAVATTALRGASAAFEFSWRTPMDVKGGVLIQRGDGKLSVADIGQAIDRETLLSEEAAGKRALFNCATGLFDLDYLIPRLEEIIRGLPIRVSEQDKEAGRYAQAEQTTWEVLGLMDDPLIFAVAKEKRFVAAKTLMESLLASPIGAKIDTNGKVDASLRAASALLRKGFDRLLEAEYGFTSVDECGTRRPLCLAELEAKAP